MVALVILIILALGVLSVQGDGCTLGRSDLPETSPNRNPGLFIDIDNPAPCSGQITNWRVCYYNLQNNKRKDSIPILLQTWQIMNNRGQRIHSYSTTITIPSRKANFQCVNITVDPADYIDVEQDDYIAVSTFNDKVLPVIGFTPNTSHLFFFPAGLNVPSRIESSTPGIVRLSNQAIHVSATIATRATVIDTTSSKIPQGDPGGGVGVGAIVGVVAVAVAVISVIIIIVVTVVLVKQRLTVSTTERDASNFNHEIPVPIKPASSKQQEEIGVKPCPAYGVIATEETPTYETVQGY